ncbi:hypothetical protein G6M86_07280 [Agrobacterium tumefaciens]|uniref:Putative tail fiber protein gp53-like C-terminal domain-containing protein n=1 Tax=Agrobacterium tumefaciens TaxID=358 RepID=A0AAJ4N0N0_AGRTU|nr:hypothetical protein G6M86_07280 [Agrobacterium tumefaciens]
MAVKLANNAFSTLAASVTSAATSLSIQAADAGKFPVLAAGDWHPATIIDSSGNMEIVRVTARASNVLTVQRAQEATTAKAFSAGSRIDVRLTAAVIASLPKDKQDIGLGNADNTADIDKPISTLQGEALNARVRVDAAQGLSAAEKTQGRGNIDAQQSGASLELMRPVAPAANKFLYFPTAASAALADLSAFARTILDDTSGAAVFATIGATQSLSQTGWVKLPNGLIIQWGRVDATGGNLAIAFPMAFPNEVFSASVVCLNSPSDNITAYYCWADSLNVGTMNVRGRFMINGGTVGAMTLSLSYIAIGR